MPNPIKGIIKAAAKSTKKVKPSAIKKTNTKPTYSAWERMSSKTKNSTIVGGAAAAGAAAGLLSKKMGGMTKSKKK